MQGTGILAALDGLQEHCFSYKETSTHGYRLFAGTEEDSPARVRSRLRTGELSISERFRLAYQARTERKALKAERNRKQAWRRYVRSNPSEQLIRMAENGVPLFNRR